ncbi:uncharacterized protein LODBEIA_P28350 [Lodderomyces beijingensis]|uniref:Major facilitator superfamily (MFS) profile domain-containing protein n=1 Tax=Lodderomyces beijingensis TaxID=1775926 RepID=A0ABP0ZNZ0_9ASCO
MAQGSFWEQMRGFPTQQLTLLCLIRLGEPMVFTSIFSYIFFMIRDFGIAKTTAEIATYAGYLSATFAIFQFLFCLQYAHASTKFGRKPVLLFGVIGTAVSTLVFGFSRNFTMAMVARSMMGALNGNISVLRVAIGEVATQKKHQNIAFSALAVMWGVGSIIGPLIGSSRLFTRPKTQMAAGNESGYDAFVESYPYAMSNIVLAGYLLFSFILAFLFLEETAPEFNKRRDYGLEIGDFLLKKMGYKVQSRHGYREVDEAEREVFVREDQIYEAVEEEEEEEEVESELLSRRFGDAARRRYSSEPLGLGPVISSDSRSIVSANARSSFTKEILTTPVVQTVLSNFLFCFHTVLYSEFFPVLLASPLASEKIHFPFTLVGGFGWETDDIGHLLSSTGIVGTIAVVVLFPILDHHLKTSTILILSFLLMPVVYASIPYIMFTGQWSTFWLYFASLTNTILASVGFPVSMILIHRASPEKHRALINGASISLNSLARGISPILFGYFMTWCNEKELGGVPWLVLGLLASVCLLQSFAMKDYDEEEQ